VNKDHPSGTFGRGNPKVVARPAEGSLTMLTRASCVATIIAVATLLIVALGGAVVISSLIGHVEN